MGWNRKCGSRENAKGFQTLGLLFILSVCIAAEGDLEQTGRRDYRLLEVKDMGGQLVLPSVLQLKGQVLGRSAYTL